MKNPLLWLGIVLMLIALAVFLYVPSTLGGY